MKTLRLLLSAFTLAIAIPLHAAPLDSPETAHLRYAGNDIYLDPALSPARQAAIPPMVAAARARVMEFYGPLQARPKLVFCATMACYRGFGAIGLGYTNGTNLVIAPNGQRVAIVAHELAHDELAARLGGFSRVLDAVPQWFDEGQAVVVSGAKEYSESAWMQATQDGRAAPDLSSLASVAEWNRLTGAQGERYQFTYGTAKREVERWLRKAGRDGFRQLLAALAEGESFPSSYRRIESQENPAAEL